MLIYCFWEGQAVLENQRINKWLHLQQLKKPSACATIGKLTWRQCDASVTQQNTRTQYRKAYISLCLSTQVLFLRCSSQRPLARFRSPFQRCSYIQYGKISTLQVKLLIFSLQQHATEWTNPLQRGGGGCLFAWTLPFCCWSDLSWALHALALCLR